MSRYFGQPLDWPDHFEVLTVGVGDDIKTGLQDMGWGHGMGWSGGG